MGETQPKQSCLLLRDCFAILDYDLLGEGSLSCQENEAFILYSVLNVVSWELLALLSEKTQT